MAKFEAGERKINGQIVQVWKHKRLMRDWTLLLANSISDANRRKGKKKPEKDPVESLEAPENNEDDAFEGDADELLS